MRAVTLGLMAIATLSLAACGKTETAKTSTEASGPSVTPPSPKPGLWRQTVNVNNAAPMVNEVCLDEAIALRLSGYGDQVNPQLCQEIKTTRGADGAWNVESTCNMGTGGIVKTTSKISGDLNSEYTAESTATPTGAAVPPMNRVATIKMSGKWLGACPKPMIPGDVKMANGKTVNFAAAVGATSAAK